MGVYQKALKKFPLYKKGKIIDFMAKWKAGSERGADIVSNIELEEFLHEENMKEILQKIYDCQKEVLSIYKVEDEYKKECYKHARCAPSIRLKNLPQLVGRVVSKDGFISSLTGNEDKNNKNGKKERVLTEPEATALFVKLILGNEFNDMERDIKMTKHCAWVTWDRDDHLSKKPFDFATSPYKSHEICANLGLDPRFTNSVLMLFVYSLPDGIKLHYPTIADAELNIFFEVAHKEAMHGWTKPWPKEFLLKEGIKFKMLPKPEAIHEPIKFRCNDLFVEKLEL